MTNLQQKNVNSIQFGTEIVHVNHVLIPGSPEDCKQSTVRKSYRLDRVAEKYIKL